MADIVIHENEYHIDTKICAMPCHASHFVDSVYPYDKVTDINRMR